MLVCGRVVYGIKIYISSLLFLQCKLRRVKLNLGKSFGLVVLLQRAQLWVMSRMAWFSDSPGGESQVWDLMDSERKKKVNKCTVTFGQLLFWASVPGYYKKLAGVTFLFIRYEPSPSVGFSLHPEGYSSNYSSNWKECGFGASCFCPSQKKIFSFIISDPCKTGLHHICTVLDTQEVWKTWIPIVQRPCTGSWHCNSLCLEAYFYLSRGGMVVFYIQCA